ncbi:AraC family ligand binding domain-containing protein [Ligilactobacillus pobuzihii]|uniref:Transcriptional regulator, AraC family n=1 Tax=Ligilactobacillus pobuzihii TaxID=449659 RepID=A0A0R2LMY8_9LACO|nr:AraC family ligand binding domain-containing protein [Ligilactobacillus pobuzihii]KRK09501.1 transcriptional regulator, AraC family [Ligilactobacillus pobuzihii E100301 = KCTC 13174]KRO01307.1 transcriptional regulator, AraC family [Ligilactobacillus pobuzihii]GEN48895.1 AraC family transcriptional regulator [Ligilactobacillus pobuzihii]
MNPTVFKKLKCLNDIEKKQFKNNKFINDMPLAAQDKKTEKQTGVPSLTNNYFFKYHSVYISKHNRFAPYPKHSHKFLELNYMLSGTCKQTVDNKELTLREGDILLMNIGCSHSIESLGEDDILINLLFRDKNISFDLLNKIHSKNSLTYDFLSNISLGKKTKSNFIFFPQNSDIQKTMNSIIEEYYQQEPFSNSIIEAYLEILISKILRHHPIPTVKLPNEQEQLIFKCLKEIDENYKNITLEELANKFGYNKEYIGNLIRKYTKSNFSDLKTKQRLINANNLLQSSTLPINKIIEHVGIKNKNFFYEKFHNFYGVSPAEKRDNTSSSYKEM